jgi:hypothetical protein
MKGASCAGRPSCFETVDAPGWTLDIVRMRIAFVILALCLLGCVHAPEQRLARCPDSEMASQCTSGGLQCKQDEKRGCELCTCQRMAF